MLHKTLLQLRWMSRDVFHALGRKVSFKGRGEEELIYDEWGRELEYQSRRVKICYRK